MSSPKKNPLKRITRLAVLAISIGLAAWLTIPGLGPDILDLGRPQVTADREIIADLDALTVRASDKAPRYDRSQFGQAWADVTGSGCDTRNEILARDLARPVFRTDGCTVDQGALAEPYTASIVHFKRGADTSSLVQIDHVVALSDAWRAGAWKWDTGKRTQFANDPLNLLAVDGKANQDKGDSTADAWLPPDTGFHCEYVARQVLVKSKWNLSVTPQEGETMRAVLENCPETKIGE